MMSETPFVVGEADAGLAERRDKEINAFNAAATGYHDGRMLSVAVRGDDGDLRAGLYGWTWGGCGYIDLLWVRDDQRGTGLGARLLAAAEAEIRRRGCDRVALNTHSFQAPGFYARFGYTECGRTPGLSARPRRHSPAEAARLTRARNGGAVTRMALRTGESRDKSAAAHVRGKQPTREGARHDRIDCPRDRQRYLRS
jgi:GNAT superfamily N-acetyltransferase